MGKQPNIVFVLVDCLRSRTLAEAADRGWAPELAALRERGTFFPQTVATVTTTTPSMSSIFTGTLPFVHGVRSLRARLSDDVATLAEILRDHGYTTHAEAAGPVNEKTGLDRGFDRFHGRFRDYVHGPAWSEMRSRIATLPPSSPWFLYVHLFELHETIVPEALDRKEFGRTGYDRSVAALDRTVLGELFRLAGEDGVVIVTGDHGELVPRYKRGVQMVEQVARRLRSRALMRWAVERRGHGHIHEDEVVVPLVLAGRGIPAGRRVDTAVRHIDLFPTILELAGVDDPRRRQSSGRTLVELFERDGEDRPGYTEAVGGVRLRFLEDAFVAVRHEGYKYVKRMDRPDLWLWRLPDEKTNVIGKHPELAAKMEALLAAFGDGRELSAAQRPMAPGELAEMEEQLKMLGYL